MEAKRKLNLIYHMKKRGNDFYEDEEEERR
jgi:hypothetical protein